MAKTTGPLLSLDASGTIADTLTFSRWRGIGYARQRVIPANPQSAAQTLTRSAFKWTSDTYRSAPSLLREPWEAFAAGQPFVSRNAYMGQNTEVLRPVTVITSMIFSPGARGGIPPTSIVLTAGVDQLTVDFTNPAAPTGWSSVITYLKEELPHLMG